MCNGPLKRAVEEGVKRAGSLTRLADQLGISRQALQQWEKVPVMRVLAMEAISGVSRYELRPDVYPPPKQSSSRAA